MRERESERVTVNVKKERQTETQREIDRESERVGKKEKGVLPMADLSKHVYAFDNENWERQGMREKESERESEKHILRE